MAVPIRAGARGKGSSAEIALSFLSSNTQPLGTEGWFGQGTGLRMEDQGGWIPRRATSSVERADAVEAPRKAVVGRIMTMPHSKIASAEAARLINVSCTPIPPQAMGPPRFVLAEHRELLRDVHGSWDCGHWRDFIDCGQVVAAPDRQAILAFGPASLISNGLIYDDEHTYTLDYFQMPETLPVASQHFPALLSLLWRSTPDYNHFVIETLPRLLYCREAVANLAASLKIVWYFDLHTPYVRQYLELLGLADLPFLTASYDPVVRFTADRILLPFCYPRDPRTIAHDDLVAWYPLAASMQRLRSQLMPGVGARRRVIYASRRDVVGSTGSPRGVINEDALIALLRKRYGDEMTVFVGAGHSVTSTIELFSQARIVIGPHGGAFVNTLFCAEGTALLEFLPARQPTQYFYRTSACLGQQYWPLPIHDRGHEDALEVPLDDLLRILDVLDSGRGS